LPPTIAEQPIEPEFLTVACSLNDGGHDLLLKRPQVLGRIGFCGLLQLDPRSAGTTTGASVFSPSALSAKGRRLRG
jgi:hypothetical protein